MNGILGALIALVLGGFLAWGGVEPEESVQAVEPTPPEAIAGEAEGELQALHLAQELQSEEPAEAPHARLRASHLSAETGVVIALNAGESSGPIVRYDWDLDGDDTYDETTLGPILTTVFPENGTYEVRVRVTDAAGKAAVSDALALRIVNRTPVARFDGPANAVREREPIPFHGASVDWDGEIVDWLWDFGDGARSMQQKPAHAYSDDGIYAVTLTVIDNDGAESSIVQNIEVGNVEPTAAFELPEEGIVAGASIRFFDGSYDPSPTGSIVHVAWDFGDGTTVAGSPSADGTYTHTYGGSGSYLVTLYVVDDDGALSTARQELVIQ